MASRSGTAAPTAPSVLVLDISSNDLTTIDPECWKAKGVGGIIAGVWSPHNPPHPMANAVDECKRAGLVFVASYGLIYFGEPSAETRDTTWAIGMAKDYGAQLVALDCEIDANKVPGGWPNAPTPTIDQRIAAIDAQRTRVLGAGLEPVIYTYEPWWQTAVRNTGLFAGYKLWLANYWTNDGAQHALPAVLNLPWRDVWAHQFTSRWGAINGCGRVARDASEVYGDIPGEDSMNDQDKLAVFGSNEADPAERLANARFRYEEAAAGRALSPRDLAVNAGMGSGAGPHTHHSGGPVPLDDDPQT